ncbi:hypothetical protein [Ponticaulis profundi]|uniref:DoxX family protein n=1 Tax=Ponticaulis profundi TaxID=2665222 RepID=A0ABW1S7C9_9PROT
MLMIVRVILSLGLLVYGALRLFGTVMFLLIGAGLLQSADFESGRQLLSDALPDMNESAIIPFSPLAYTLFSGAMGLAMTLGALGALFKRIWGVWLLALYNALFLAMFVNFGIVNAKMVHLGVTILLTFILYLLVRAKPTR